MKCKSEIKISRHTIRCELKKNHLGPHAASHPESVAISISWPLPIIATTRYGFMDEGRKGP